MWCCSSCFVRFLESCWPVRDCRRFCRDAAGGRGVRGIPGSDCGDLLLEDLRLHRRLEGTGEYWSSVLLGRRGLTPIIPCTLSLYLYPIPRSLFPGPLAPLYRFDSDPLYTYFIGWQFHTENAKPSVCRVQKHQRFDTQSPFLPQIHIIMDRGGCIYGKLESLECTTRLESLAWKWSESQ